MAIDYQHPERQGQSTASHTPLVAEGWHADPDGVHQYRYHDGREWTVHVANDGNVTQVARAPRRIAKLPIALSSARATLAVQQSAVPENALIRDRAWVDRLITDLVSVCGDTMDALQSALEVANHVVGARRMAGARPQHDISIQTFADMAERKEQEWRPLMMAARDLHTRARRISQELADILSPEFDGLDPDMYVFSKVPAETNMLAAAVEFLRIDLSSLSAEAFVERVGQANNRVTTSPGYGEPGYEGLLYSAHPYLPIAELGADYR